MQKNTQVLFTKMYKKHETPQTKHLERTFKVWILVDYSDPNLVILGNFFLKLGVLKHSTFERHVSISGPCKDTSDREGQYQSIHRLSLH